MKNTLSLTFKSHFLQKHTFFQNFKNITYWLKIKLRIFFETVMLNFNKNSKKKF